MECGRQDCELCLQETEEGVKEWGKCLFDNLVYEYSCTKWKENNKTDAYKGETSRSFYERSSEHKRSIENDDENNAMVKHNYDKHLD